MSKPCFYLNFIYFFISYLSYSCGLDQRQLKMRFPFQEKINLYRLHFEEDVPDRIITDHQVRKLMKLKTLSIASAKSGMCENSAHKYLKSCNLLLTEKLTICFTAKNQKDTNTGSNFTVHFTCCYIQR